MSELVHIFYIYNATKSPNLINAAEHCKRTTIVGSIASPKVIRHCQSASEVTDGRVLSVASKNDGTVYITSSQ